MNFSVIMPCEADRVGLLKNTLDRYANMPFVDDCEFLIISRTLESLSCPTLDLKVFRYTYEGFFNCSMALNLGVRSSKYDNIIITCPEVMPVTDVLSKFNELGRGNYLSTAMDLDADGNIARTLVAKGKRDQSPEMYFLALFKKEDIEAINGWDESFMGGFGWEDTDFSNRWKRAGLPYEVRDDLIVHHQYHGRTPFYKEYFANQQKLINNDFEDVIRPKKGLLYEK